MALYRPWLPIYTYFAGFVVSIPLSVPTPPFILLTAVPYVDGTSGASWASGVAYDVDVRTGRNTKRVTSGDDEAGSTAGAV